MSIHTLVYASVGSAVAAIVTSQFWTAGTPIAAAMTPVIVALVSELLRRPTEKIAQRLTTETPALRKTDVLPEASGAGPPPREEERRPQPARDQPVADPRSGTRRRPPPQEARLPGAGAEPEFRVYRAGGPSRLPWKAILVTAAIAFAIAATVLTLPEVIAGHALFGSDRDTTLLGGGRSDRSQPRIEEEEQQTEQQTEQQQTQPTETGRTQPDRTAPAPQPTPDDTTPTTPRSTSPQPAQPRSSPPGAPAPQRP